MYRTQIYECVQELNSKYYCFGYNEFYRLLFDFLDNIHNFSITKSTHLIDLIKKSEKLCKEYGYTFHDIYEESILRLKYTTKKFHENQADVHDFWRVLIKLIKRANDNEKDIINSDEFKIFEKNKYGYTFQDIYKKLIYETKEFPENQTDEHDLWCALNKLIKRVNGNEKDIINSDEFNTFQKIGVFLLPYLKSNLGSLV